MTGTRRLAGIAAASFVCGLSTSALALEAITLPVDCGRGQTITKALNFTDVLHRPLVLVVRGTCNENVTIDRDDITLKGDPNTGATINGPSAGSTITVRASRVLLDRLTVRGGNPSGIALVGRSDVDISNCDVQGAVSHGINVAGNSSVTITNCSIQYNGRSGVGIPQGSVAIVNSQIAFNSGNGVRVRGNSNLTVNGGAISSNAWSGIDMESGSGVISGTTITANGTNAALPEGSRRGVLALASYVQINNSSITNNTGSGVAVVQGGSLSLYNSTVTGNGSQGVILYLGASGNLGGGTISGNSGNGVSVSVNSTAQITGGATILNNARHGVELNLGSKLGIFEPSITVGGNAWFGLFCNDAESSAADTSLIAFSPANGQGGASCTGY
jgi:Right handed beta helix region